MTDKKKIDRVDNGEAYIVQKKTIQWSVIATIIIFLFSQALMFGIWKGGLDERILNLEKSGSRVAVKNQILINSLIHNQKRIMEKLNIKWESLGDK